MAAMMVSIFLRNSAKASSVNRLVLSNPCLAGLANGQRTLWSLQGKSSALKPASSIPITTLSLSTKQASTQAGQDYAKLWTVERALALSMVPLVPAAFIIASPVMDYLLAFTFALHAHWGLEAIVVDYIRPKVFGPTLPKIALAVVYGLSIFTLGGLFYFNYSDVGIVNAIKLLWKL